MSGVTSNMLFKILIFDCIGHTYKILCDTFTNVRLQRNTHFHLEIILLQKAVIDYIVYMKNYSNDNLEELLMKLKLIAMHYI